MGYSIKHKKGKWQATSSISDEKLLDKPGTKEDLKKAFIERKVWRFLEEMITIEMEFPFQWTVNDKIVFDRDGEMFTEWWLRKHKEGTLSKDIYSKSIEIVKKYNLEEYFRPLLGMLNIDELDLSDDDIGDGDFFMYINDDGTFTDYIHLLSDDHEMEDHVWKGIDVIVMNKRDYDWNKKSETYKKINY